MQHTINCPTCNAVFTPANNRQKFCKGKCRAIFNQRLRMQRITPEQKRRENLMYRNKILRSPDPLGEVLTIQGLRYDR